MALHAGGIGTWEWNLVSGSLEWSAQTALNLGIAPIDALPSLDRLLAVTHVDDRPNVAGALAGFSEQPGPMRLELRTVWPNGEVHWIVFLGAVTTDPDGRPAVMRGITIDSTRRRLVEQANEVALRESEARLRELNEVLERLADTRARQLDASRAQMQVVFDVSPDWLTLFRATSDGRFIYEDLNRATELAYGLSRDKVIGRPLEEILGHDAAQIPLAHMRECIRSGLNQRYLARRILSGPPRTIDVMFARVPEKYDGDFFIVATARDITEREAIEQQLLQAQKMESVGQLTGGVAHDFNNLLTTIIGNLELLGPRLATDLRGASYLSAAQRAAENGAKLTAQLLAFSRRQHLEPRTIDLNAIIGGMREILARTIGTSVEVVTDLTDDLWPALVDPTQIEVALLNLAINSRDAMPAGGTLSIETANLRAGVDPMPAELNKADCIRVSVRDTGTGMTEDVLHSAVEPFFTTKDVGKGSGLGLSQVYGMVRQSNGCLQIDSTVGGGTAIHLYLPRAPDFSVTLDADPVRPVAERNNTRLLVVDDDPEVREITVQMLREMDYGVAEVESGQGALDALAQGDRYDLIVIDVAMPGISGIETVARIRQNWPSQRILYVSGYVDSAGSAPQTGDDLLVKKPFRLADLGDGIRRALGTGLLSPEANVVPLHPRVV
ncbi:MAG: response regulator [Alphaproteobacteria bacterium]|nr:response regulator [Alphaproteobacteria bacterium]